MSPRRAYSGRRYRRRRSPLPALLLVIVLAALVLGADARLGIALVSLMAHELSHVAMALALKVRVSEIELMPMGGAARVEGVWRLRGAQVALIALAGPQLARRLTRSAGVPLLSGALMGAVLLLAADLLGQRLAYVANLPIGLMTGLLGGFYLLWLLLRSRRI